jgi:hypothetical protein
LGVIGNYWELLGIIESYWELLRVVGNYWELLGIIESRWKLLRVIGNYWELLGIIESYWELLRVVGNYWELLGIIESRWKLLRVGRWAHDGGNVQYSLTMRLFWLRIARCLMRRKSHSGFSSKGYFFIIIFSGGWPYPLLRLRSTTYCRLSRLYMLHYVWGNGGAFRHY